jgi:hypothetical protein
MHCKQLSLRKTTAALINGLLIASLLSGLSLAAQLKPAVANSGDSREISTSSSPTPVPARIRHTHYTNPVVLHLAALGLSKPFHLFSPPDSSGRLFILDHSGLVRIIDKGGNLLEMPYLDLGEKLTGEKAAGSHGKLLAAVFHPAFSTNGRFYALYSFPDWGEGRQEGAERIRLAEYQPSRIYLNRADLATEKILYEVAQERGGFSSISLHMEANGELILETADKDAQTGTSRMCFDLSGSAGVPGSCPRADTSEAEVLTSLSQGLLLEGIRIASSKRYQGQYLPAYRDGYIFIGIENQNGQQISRLYAALLGSSGRWVLEELISFSPEEKINGLAADLAGELYLFSWGSPGKIFKLVPLVETEKNLVEDPNLYLPLSSRYGRMVRKGKVYHTLDDVRNGQAYGAHGGGNHWVSERGSAVVEGRRYYRVAWSWGNEAWVSAADVVFDAPLSRLRGIRLKQQAGLPLALSYQTVNVRSQPGVIREETIIGTLRPYELVTIQEKKTIQGAVWYAVGAHQWIHSNGLRLIAPEVRPEKVGMDEKWIEINLREQVMIAHQGDRPVFATLISTGRSGLETKPGLFKPGRCSAMRLCGGRKPNSPITWPMYLISFILTNRRDCMPRTGTTVLETCEAQAVST